MIDFLNQGWVGIAIGVMASVVTYLLSRRRAVPKATIVASHELTWNDSTDLPEGFELTFLNKKIPHICRGLVRFWNGGNETLQGSSVPSHDRIRLTISDGEFLVVGLPKASNPVNLCQFEVDPQDPKTAYFTFDFLDPNEGAVLGFLHTSKTAAPELKGTIKGHKIQILEHRIQSKARQRMNRRVRMFKKGLPIGLILAGVLLFGLAILPKESFERFAILSEKTRAERLHDSDVAIRLGGMLGGASYILIGGVYLWARRRKHPKSLDFG